MQEMNGKDKTALRQNNKMLRKICKKLRIELPF
jgi:hypothetical protein